MLLTLEDLEPYLVHGAASAAESGRDGDMHFGPYSRDEPYPMETQRDRTRERWTRPLDVPEWRRAWGEYDDGRIIASANVAGGPIAADLHRVGLGMSVLREYRGQGRGRRLLDAVITWCREQPSIAWIDLGVFEGNDPAHALYRSAGFETVGITHDRWRVDDVHIHEINMTLHVG